VHAFFCNKNAIPFTPGYLSRTVKFSGWPKQPCYSPHLILKL
jgi:hypothetical protein